MPTALVVDDSAVDRLLAGKLLEKNCSCTVIYAANGKEALAQLEQHVVDGVITDLQMPHMNGLELVSAIKSDFPMIPAILMTGKGSEEIAAEALQKGAASYVPKKRLAEDLAPTFQHVLAASREDRTHSRLMHHLVQGEMAFEIHNDLPLIRSVVAYLQQMLRSLPLGDQVERLRVGIAIEEALNNAYYHGNLEIPMGDQRDRTEFDQLARQRRTCDPYCDRRIFVTAKVSRKEATITVRDEGPGFDIAKLPETTDVQHYEESAGRGVVLMKSIMDEVRFNAAGNEVTMTKRAVKFEEVEEEAGESK